MECPELQPIKDYREAAILAVALLIILAYQHFFWKKVNTDEKNTVFGFANASRKIWVESFLSNKKHSLNGVQAIRNELLTGLFIGETSFAAVTVIISVTSAVDLTCSMKILGSRDPITGDMEPWITPMTKVQVVTILLATIFAVALQGIRLQRHLSCFIGVADTSIAEEVKKMAEKMHKRAATFQWIAMRLIHLLLPALALLLGPTFCLGATIVITIFMFVTDFIIVQLPQSAFPLGLSLRRTSLALQHITHATHGTGNSETVTAAPARLEPEDSAPAGASATPDPSPQQPKVSCV
mmetsp:Transcript_46077/g.94247  ORF Transcript_46077/g.94247 Transcript_46077/m.94247 type:complete len:296 (+) Transcript_46077:185-1072(+)